MNAVSIADVVAFGPDVQARRDDRGVTIDRVGIRGLRYPILLHTNEGSEAAVGEWELTVELEPNRRGTHMSRFIETLDAWCQDPMSGSQLLAMLRDLRGRLDAQAAYAQCATTLFIRRVAPVSGLSAHFAIDCRYEAASHRESTELLMSVRVPITTLCPCSKEISEYGAHNQRGYVTIGARTSEGSALGFTDLIAIAETSGSAVIYPLLKRSDERHLTMQAYDSPAFVEDVVRNATLRLASDPRIETFRVEAENHESIHDHSAIATVCWERQ